MKKFSGILCLVCLSAIGFVATAYAQVNVGVRIGANGGLDAFHVAIGDYFKVSDQQVETCQDSNISDEDQPVVFFMAQRANVPPESVILLRSRGWSWMQIALHFRLNPRIFYTPGTYEGTPYENGHRAFHGRGRIRLSDADIVNFVNLKFASEHYGHDPREIAQMRAQGRSFREIHDGFAQKEERIEWDAKEEPRHRDNRRMRQDDRPHPDQNGRNRYNNGDQNGRGGNDHKDRNDRHDDNQ